MYSYIHICLDVSLILRTLTCDFSILTFHILHFPSVCPRGFCTTHCVTGKRNSVVVKVTGEICADVDGEIWPGSLPLNQQLHSMLISAIVREAGNKKIMMCLAGLVLSIHSFIKRKRTYNFHVMETVFLWGITCFERNHWQCSRQTNRAGFVFGCVCVMSISRVETDEELRQIDTNSCSSHACRVFFVCLNNSGTFHPHLPLNVIKPGCNYILQRTFQHTFRALIGNLHL